MINALRFEKEKGVIETYIYRLHHIAVDSYINLNQLNSQFSLNYVIINYEADKKIIICDTSVQGVSYHIKTVRNVILVCILTLRRSN